MAIPRGTKWQFVATLLTTSYFVCVQGDNSAEDFFKHNKKIFLVGFTNDSIPPVKCIRSTSSGEPDSLLVEYMEKAMQYKEKGKDYSGHWSLQSRKVKYIIKSDSGQRTVFAITEIQPPAKNYPGYQGKFPLIKYSRDCLIFGDGLFNEHNKQRCMTWGAGKTFSSLPPICQSAFDAECIAGTKVDDHILSDCYYEESKPK